MAPIWFLDILAEARSSGNEDDHDTHVAEMGLGIRAELYKLNIYSGPSGRFEAHVDTPRSETQIGSLVVCLPSDFEGGVLSASHQTNTVTFDWSASSSTGQTPSIKWAAFYSDCSHEIQVVTTGHRVTLTYSLYASRGSGFLAGKKHSMDATRLPTYQPLINPLRSRTFTSDGEYVAIGLAHAYPHTHALLHRQLPEALEGADMMIYEVLLALNLRTELVRVMDLSKECADMRVHDAQFYHSDESDDERMEQPRGGDVFYRLGFEPIKIWGDEMVEKYDLVNKIGWNHLGFMQWIRHPRDSRLVIAYLAVSPELMIDVPRLTCKKYGNEASMATKYSSLLSLLALPPFNRGFVCLKTNQGAINLSNRDNNSVIRS